MRPQRLAGSEGSRIVDCPACKGPAVYASGNRWRPFCSERCRQRDLGAWASEDYRVPAPAADPAMPDQDPSPDR